MVSIIVSLSTLLCAALLHLIVPSAIVAYTLPLFIVPVLGALYQRRRWKRVDLPRALAPVESRSATLEEALDRERLQVEELRASVQSDDRQNTEDHGVIRRLSETLQVFDNTLPVLDALNKRVVERTERSNIDLSDRIFSIAEISKRLGSEIQTILTDLVDGDTGLERDIDELQAEVGRFQRLISGMENMSSRYLQDMSTLKNAVGNIGKFTENLTDLADQTSLLSINASIEAARAGKAGAGFRIIASEVQSLARRSKSIAEEINSHIIEAAEAVEQSFSEQESSIAESIGQIRQARESLTGLSGNLKPQIERISGTVEESKALSGGVTEDLNGIIVSLQYHDIIRQILDHSILILKDVKALCIEGQNGLLDSRPLSDDDVAGRVRELTTPHFTVDDEWEVLGVSVRDTSGLEERKRKMKEHQLEGDITLF